MSLYTLRSKLIAISLILLAWALPTPASANALFAGDLSSTLWTVDSTTGAAVEIGSMGPHVISDLAVSPSGDLYAVGYSTLWRVDKATGAKTMIGAHGIAGANALAFNPSGILFLAGGSQLATVDITTGAGTVIGSTGFNSAGDIAFGLDGELYQTADGSVGNQLVILDTTTGAGTAVGDIGFGNVFGLAAEGSGLVGLTSRGWTISIDTATGGGVAIASGGIDANGATPVAGGIATNGAASASASGLPIPEPTSTLLFTAGVFVVAWAIRRKRESLNIAN